MREKKTAYTGSRPGFSLVELMIVITIMSLLVSITSISYSLVRSADVKGTAYDINSSLTELKSNNMANSRQSYMRLYRYNDSYYIDYTEDAGSYTPSGAGKEIGDSRADISCDGTALDEGSVVTIGMQKKDGAFSMGPESIVVSSDDTTYEVSLVHETGKHYVEEK